MKEKLSCLYMAVLFVMVLGCTTKKPVPSVDAVINQGCLFDNSKYCGWMISTYGRYRDEDSYFIRHYYDSLTTTGITTTGTTTGIIDRKCNDTLILIVYPEGRYDSIYNVAYSLYKKLSLIAEALNSDLVFYYCTDSLQHFKQARMDFYNKDYDTNITLFQIDSALNANHNLANRHNFKSIAKDWYTYDK